MGQGCLVTGAVLFGDRLCRERDSGLLLAAGVLETRAKPADDAASFLLGPLVVESHEAGEDFFICEVVRPAVGVGHRNVETVVYLSEYGNESLFMYLLFVPGERVTGAKLVKNYMPVIVSLGCCACCALRWASSVWPSSRMRDF